MAKAKGDIIINIEKCKGCELCMEACPEGALELSKHVNQKGYLYAVKVEDTCTGCTSCALVCPDGAITVYRKIEGKKKLLTKVTNVASDMTLKVGE